MPRYTHAIFTLCLALAFSTAAGVCASKNFRALQLAALKEMREAVIASQAADDIMIKEIDAVSREFERILSSRMRKESSRPLELNKRETAQIAHRVSRLLADNPYKKKDNQKADTQTTANTSDVKGLLQAKNMPQPAQSSIVSSSLPANQSSDAPPPGNGSSPFRPPASNLALDSRNGPATRVKIMFDSNVSFMQAETWRKQMPLDWTAEPGTIQIVHNGFDTCLIWGAGVEGRPVFDREKKRFKLVALRLGSH